MKKFSSIRILLTVFVALLGITSFVLGLSLKTTSFADESASVFKGYGLTLTDDLAIRIYTNETYTDDITVTYQNEKYTVSKSGDHYYFDGITPQHIDASITAAATDGSTLTASVADYCKGVLAKTAKELELTEGKSKMLKELVTAVLNYGKAADAYIKGSADSDVTNYVDGKYTAPSVKAPTSSKINGSTTYIRGAGARFESKIGLYFTVVAPDGVDGLTVKINESNYNKFVSIEEGVYRVYVKNIYATSYDSVYTAQVYKDGKAVGNKVTYSVYNYVVNMAKKSEPIGDLVKSLYVFSQSAQDYDNNSTIEIKLPEGFTVTETYPTKAANGSTVATPTVSTNETGRAVQGWKIQDGIGAFADLSSGTTLPESGAVLYPVLASDCNLDVNDACDKGAVQDAGLQNPDHSDTYISGYKKSTVFNTNDFTEEYLWTHDDLSSGNWFRLNTYTHFSGGLIKDRSYDFTYKLTNHGTEELSFTLYNCTNGYNVLGTANGNTPTHAENESVTIAAGETVTVSFDNFGYTATVENGNFISLFIMNSDIDKLALGVRINVAETPIPKKAATITVKLPKGVTLNGSSTTINTYTGELLLAKLPTEGQLSNVADGRTLLGWYNVADHTVIGDTTKIHKTEITVAPYWSKIDGYRDLDIGSSALPNYNSSTINTGFTKTANNSTVISAGDDGYAELGEVVTYSSNMAAGKDFRLDTVVGNNAIAKDRATCTFVYTFENRGENDIHLKLYTINNSRIKVTDDNGNEDAGHAIELDPGESMQISFTVTIKYKDPNSNVLPFFEVTQAMASGMELGVALSVRLGS